MVALISENVVMLFRMIGCLGSTLYIAVSHGDSVFSLPHFCLINWLDVTCFIPIRWPFPCPLTGGTVFPQSSSLLMTLIYSFTNSRAQRKGQHQLQKHFQAIRHVFKQRPYKKKWMLFQIMYLCINVFFLKKNNTWCHFKAYVSVPFLKKTRITFIM